MKNLYQNIKKTNVINKLILLLMFFLLIYFAANLILAYNESRRVEKEILNFKFNVKNIYFEYGYNQRVVFDKVIFIELEEPISKEQFNNLSFAVPNENVTAEYVNEKKIKINLISPFEKNKKNYLQINFYNKNVYRFTYISALQDENYYKDIVPDKSPLEN